MYISRGTKKGNKTAVVKQPFFFFDDSIFAALC